MALKSTVMRREYQRQYYLLHRERLKKKALERYHALRQIEEPVEGFKKLVTWYRDELKFGDPVTAGCPPGVAEDTYREWLRACGFLEA